MSEVGVKLSRMDTLPTQLACLIQEACLSELALSRYTGISQPVINRVVTGKTPNPKIATLIRLADYFAISIDRLVGRDTVLNMSTLTPGQTIAVIPLITCQAALAWPNPETDVIQWLLTDVCAGPQAFAISLADDLSPVFEAGTQMIIDPDERVTDQAFVLMQLAGHNQGVCRQVLFDGQDRYAKSMDPAFSAEPLKPTDRIIGVIRQVDWRRPDDAGDRTIY